MTLLPRPTRLSKNRKTMLALSLAGLFAIGLSTVPFPRILVWNVTPSVPRGLYLVLPGNSVGPGDLVVCRLPLNMRELAHVRGYLPRNIPLIKPVAAMAGMNVCRKDDAVLVNGRSVAIARRADHRHRSLPSWEGCKTLGAAEVFLMNPAVPDSFDGRYFGPIPASLIEGRALPLITEAQGPVPPHAKSVLPSHN